MSRLRGERARMGHAGLWILTVLAGFTSLAHATVLIPADFADLVSEAQAIVHGRVVDVRPVWTDDRRRVDTVVTLEAEGYFKGQLGETVLFRVPGGEMGRYRSLVVGAPVFREGEEVVLFLSARGPAVPHLLGLSQGVFRIVRDERSGRAMVTPPVLLGGGPEPARVVRGDPGRRPLSLEAFGAGVREALGRGRERRTPATRPRRLP